MADLTPKQALFVESYLGLAAGNGTQAARLAGYRGTDATLAQVAAENLRKPHIAAAIAERLKEAKDAMGADEVLERLTGHGRGSMADFFSLDEDGKPRLDLRKAEAEGKLHLIKKLSWTKDGPRLELYDAQAATVHLGRHHGLFTDNIDLGAKKSLVDLIREADARGRAGG